MVTSQRRFVYLTDGKVAVDSFRLARLLFEQGELNKGDGNRIPNAFFGIWRGGANVGSYVTHALEGYGVRQRTFAAAGKSYTGRDQTGGIEIYNMEELMSYLRGEGYTTVCGIDDVFDTGRTWDAFHHIMRNGLRINDAQGEMRDDGGRRRVFEFLMRTKNERYLLKVPLTSDVEPLNQDVRVMVAVLYWKPNANKTDLKPDLFVEEVDASDWIVFPWGAPADLSREELASNYPDFEKALYR